MAQGTILPKTTDVVIAYLPLAHILELLVETASLSQVALPPSEEWEKMEGGWEGAEGKE